MDNNKDVIALETALKLGQAIIKDAFPKNIKCLLELEAWLLRALEEKESRVLELSCAEELQLFLKEVRAARALLTSALSSIASATTVVEVNALLGYTQAVGDIITTVTALKKDAESVSTAAMH